MTHLPTGDGSQDREEAIELIPLVGLADAGALHERGLVVLGVRTVGEADVGLISLGHATAEGPGGSQQGRDPLPGARVIPVDVHGARVAPGDGRINWIPPPSGLRLQNYLAEAAETASRQSPKPVPTFRAAATQSWSVGTSFTLPATSSRGTGAVP